MFFLTLYVREAHPDTMISIEEWRKIDSAEKRTARARDIVTALQAALRKQVERIPMVIDEMDNSVGRAYGGRPNAAFIIDKEGKLIYKAEWFRSTEVDKELARIFNKQAEKQASAKSDDDF